MQPFRFYDRPRAVAFAKPTTSTSVKRSATTTLFFAGDADALMAGMEESARNDPDKRLDVQHALEDGDLVAVHSHLRQKPGDSGAAVVHLFRFEAMPKAEIAARGALALDDSLAEALDGRVLRLSAGRSEIPRSAASDRARRFQGIQDIGKKLSDRPRGYGGLLTVLGIVRTIASAKRSAAPLDEPM